MKTTVYKTKNGRSFEVDIITPIDTLFLKLTTHRNFLATITSLFIPETLGKPLSQTMEEAENGYSNNSVTEKISRTKDDMKINEGFNEGFSEL